MKTSIALVAEHRLLAPAFANVIPVLDGFDLMFVAENRQDLLAHLRRKQIPDILLLDLDRPEMDGFEMAQYLQQQYPDVRILALSRSDRSDQITRMVRYGVKGYLLKGCRPSALRLALEDLRTKGFHYSGYLTSKLIKNLNVSERGPNAIRMNNREAEFLKLSCSELTYVEIADRMCVAPRTVDGYRESLFQKMNVKSRVGMVLEALRLGLVELPAVPVS